MKNLITTIFVLASLNLYSQKINGLGNTVEVKSGPIMMLGGGAFMTMGLLTRPIMEAGSTTDKKPFYKQVRNLPIITGAAIFTVGIGFTIGGR
jgi:hypothetical protein